MPNHENNNLFGTLFVTFDVAFVILLVIASICRFPTAAMIRQDFAVVSEF